MRLLTFNLWHGLSPTSPVAFSALEPDERRRLRLEHQIEVLRHAQPDICFFQEVNPVGRRAPELGRALGLTHAFQPDLVGLKLFGLGVPLNLNSGLAILARPEFSLKKLRGLSLSRSGPNLVHAWASWQLKEERFALICEAQVKGLGPVLLIDTHLHHGLEMTDDFARDVTKVADQLELPEDARVELQRRLAAGNHRRALEINRVLRALDELLPRYEAVFFAGDFNASPTSELSQILRASGFRDAWGEVNGDPGHTFDAAHNEANHILQSEFPLTLVVEDLSFDGKIKEALLKLARQQEFRPRRIDFLWIRGERVRVKKAELIGRPDRNGLAPSDHFGVLVELDGTH